ncbi:MAG: NINE protein [Pyrinomonadaceae bacterium]
MATKIVKCPNCNTENTGLENFCRNCGSTLPGEFGQQNYQNQQMQSAPSGQSGSIPGADKKLAAGLCGILLGGLGVHKFVLGYNQEGVYMLVGQVVAIVLAVISCGFLFFLPMVISVIGLVEGIMYLTKSDEEFVHTYITNKKPWF